jgi:hypothetical protein
MHYPSFANLHEFEKHDITKDKLIRAAQIYDEIFGEEFLSKANQRKQSYSKMSLYGILDRKPIFKWLNSSVLNDIIFFVDMAEILETFKTQESFKDYISRLKDDNNHDSSVYELFIAQFFNRKVNNVLLQQNSTHGNPVEISFEIDNEQYWIECKSNYHAFGDEPMVGKIINKLMPVFGTLPIKTAAYIYFDNEIATPEDFKKFITEASGIMHRISRTGFTHPYFEATSFGHMIFLKFNSNDDIPLLSDVNYDKNTEIIAQTHAPVDPHNPGSPDMKRLDEGIRQRVLAVRHPKELLNSSSVTSEVVINEIKKKVSQQKSILESGAEVVLVFNKTSKSTVFSQVKQEITKRWSKYPNLTILFINYYPENDRIIFNVTNVLESEKFKAHHLA